MVSQIKGLSPFDGDPEREDVFADIELASSDTWEYYGAAYGLDWNSYIPYFTVKEGHQVQGDISVRGWLVFVGGNQDSSDSEKVLVSDFDVFSETISKEEENKWVLRSEGEYFGHTYPIFEITWTEEGEEKRELLYSYAYSEEDVEAFEELLKEDTFYFEEGNKSSELFVEKSTPFAEAAKEAYQKRGE